MSSEYFVDRQDRYIHFGHAGFFCFFFFTFCWSRSLVSGSLACFYHDVISALSECGELIGQVQTNFTKQDSFNKFLNLIYPERESVDDNMNDKEDKSVFDETDTWVYPGFQCQPLGIDQDEIMFKALVSSIAPSHGTFNMATAYLNPPLWLEEMLASTLPLGAVNILTAHSQSHGFRSAKGVMSLVPKCYALIQSKLIGNLKATRQSHVASGVNDTIEVLSYNRPCWTFHAKGIWIFPDTGINESINSLSKVSAITVLGSSNYGRRSFELDFESQLVMSTRDPHLSKSLKAEWEHLSNPRFVTKAKRNDMTESYSFLSVSTIVPIVSFMMSKFL